MSNPNRQQRLLGLMQSTYERELAFVRQLTPEQRAEDGSFKRWSARLVVAHNAEWKARLAQNLNAARTGGELDHDEDFDHANMLIYAQYEDRPWESIEGLMEAGHLALVEETAELDPEALESFEFVPWQEGRPLWRLIVITGHSHPLLHIAEYFRDRGELARAAEVVNLIARQAADLDDSPEWLGTSAYNLACYYALLGKKDEALAKLRQAFTLFPNLIEWSQQDADLDSLRDEPEYREMFEEVSKEQ